MIDFKFMTSGNEERIYNYLNNLCHTQDCFCNKVYIRFINVYAKTEAIDIYVDDTMVAEDLKFGQITQYILSYPGKCKISVYRSGKKDYQLLDIDAEYIRNTVYTAVVLSNKDTNNLYLIKEVKEEIPPIDEAVISYTNLVDKEGSYDLFIANGTVVFRDVGYCDTSPNIKLMPSVEKFIIKNSLDDKLVYETSYIELEKGMYYSVYSVYSNNDIKLFVIPSGLNYLDVC